MQTLRSLRPVARGGVEQVAAPLPRPSSSSRRVAARAANATANATNQSGDASRPRLFDVPVSNNGARVRYVVYSQNLDVSIEPPTNLGGGLRSPEYLALNPQGKMPALTVTDKGGAAAGLYESETIVSYLLDRYCAPGTLQAKDPLARARQHLATRVHDLYVTTVQGAMYKGGMSPQERSAGLRQLSTQLDALEAIVAAGGGPFVAGGAVTTADAALAPTFQFMVFILPKVFGWRDVFSGRPALRRWWAALREEDVAMARVLDEVKGGLEVWEAKGRWDELGITEQVAKGEAQYAF